MPRKNPRREGWREKIEPGLYRYHPADCATTADHKTTRRCGCPFVLVVPGDLPGRTRQVRFEGTRVEAQRERHRLRSVGVQAPMTVAEVGTVTDFAAAWFRAKQSVWAYKTLENREDDFVRRIAPALGDVELVALDRERVEVWLGELIRTSSSRRMIVQTVATLRAMLATAVEWKRIPNNPAAGLRLPKPDPTTSTDRAHRTADFDQLEAVFAAAGCARTETMLRGGGESGMRRGELIGLRWPDVDLRARTIQIRRQVVQVRLPEGGHRKEVTSPKTGRESTIGMTEAMALRLADWYQESVVERGGPADGYVWAGKGGGPMHNRSLHRALERACLRAGVVDEKGRPLLSPHRLRHSAASVMLSRDVPLPVVSAQLTHSSTRVTSQVYAHVLHGDRGRGMAAFDAARSVTSADDVARDVAPGEREGEKPLPV